MSWAYPAAFAVMAAESAGGGPPPPASVAAAGWALFVASKALKYWAIAALGPRWTFRVLVLPAEPLVSSGPYAWLSVLLRRRIQVEDEALRHLPCSSPVGTGGDA
jgi:methyltransferase